MNYLKSLLVLLAFGSQAPAAAEMPLSGEFAAILYFQMAAEPLPLRSMLLEMSTSDFENEFERQAFLDKQALPYQVIVHAIEEKDRFSQRVRARLGEYDFTNNYFPLEGVHENTYLTIKAPPGVYGPSLAIEILNSGEFRQLKLEPDAARRLLEDLGSDKRMLLRFVLRPVSSEQKDFSGGQTLSVYRSLQMYAESVTLLHGNEDNELAVMHATSAFEDHSPEERTLTEFDNRYLTDPWAQAWGSREHFEALIEHYNLENWKAFERIEVASPCVNEFGYSRCQSLVERRRQLVLRCTNALESDKLCWRIQGLPYSTAESER